MITASSPEAVKMKRVKNLKEAANVFVSNKRVPCFRRKFYFCNAIEQLL